MKNEKEKSLFGSVLELKTKMTQGKERHHYYRTDKKDRYKRCYYIVKKSSFLKTYSH